MSEEIFNTNNLKQIPLFKSVSGEDLQKLAATMQRVHYAPGEIICYEGDRGDSFYTILNGEAEIIKALGQPEEQLLIIWSQRYGRDIWYKATLGVSYRKGQLEITCVEVLIPSMA